MGFRFQKRISILPGVRINLSKSGVSTSLGPRGADVNIGKDGVTANAGIPGTGLSYRQKVSSGGKGGWLAVLLVKVQHADEADELFAKLMGDVVDPRREFIQDNALYAAVDV
ncbi:MAG TPA: DUF4236 domain-containing protein [Rhizomicrobium sp.]|nr:DUF4236 domain-containing protein [Rhizomicrobium sp.]